MKRKRAKRPTVQERRRAAKQEFLKSYYALPKEAFFPAIAKYKAIRVSKCQLELHSSLVKLLIRERGARFQLCDDPDKNEKT
jgi:hypothetical protein